MSEDGQVHLRECEESADWSSLDALAADYWRYERRPEAARDADPTAAYSCVVKLVTMPASDRALDLIGALLRSAANDEGVGLVAAGPLEDLFAIYGEAHRFIHEAERRARTDQKWAFAIRGVWLARDGDPDINRRLAAFGATYADGASPP